MPRRGNFEKRTVPPDPRFGSDILQRFINKLMERGKKGVAERIVYDALDLVEERTGRDPLEVFSQAIMNTRPAIEVKPRRVGGATYQVPVQVPENRRESLAMRWLLQATAARPGKSMSDKLANEILDAFNNTGAAVKRREDTHRMAEANKAFAHYNW
jgi:small subunit ribosomal protein S7